MISRRPVYMVLSPRSLDYAQLAIETLLVQSADDLHLHLITDSTEDRETLQKVLEQMGPDSRHVCEVYAECDLADAEAKRFAHYPNLRMLRHGHPCWRKITDPLLMTQPGAEMILLDPDLYFPNRFRFEKTPDAGLLLMWQRPNCLLPDETVRAAMKAKIRLARHVDIGVAHWRVSPGMSELDWLDWLIGKLADGKPLPRMMHVEAIVWSAIAMELGGGYLDPSLWVCWHRTQEKRVRLKLGATGKQILRSEPWESLKCFHGGGAAKWWVPEIVGEQRGVRDLSDAQQTKVLPFIELTTPRYEYEQRTKSVVSKLGYYKVFGSKV